MTLPSPWINLRRYVSQLCASNSRLGVDLGKAATNTDVLSLLSNGIAFAIGVLSSDVSRYFTEYPELQAIRKIMLTITANLGRYCILTTTQGKVGGDEEDEGETTYFEF